MRVKFPNQINTEFETSGDLELCFTGPLILHGDPSHVKETANKAYVDTKFLSLDSSNLVTGILPVERLSAYTGDVSNVNGSNSFTLNPSGINSGIYTKLTVDSKGRVLAGESLSVTDIPSLSWNKITKNRPTTLAGYGITDGIKKTGDTVDGGLIVNGIPTLDLSAATKEYAETVLSNSAATAPIGTVIGKTTDITPEGFLRANGGQLNKVSYLDLYNVIGDEFAIESERIVSGSGKPWKQQYDINTEQSEVITNWTIGTSLPTPIAYSQAIVTKNKVYILGGRNFGGPFTTIYRANINEDGSLGEWVQEGNLYISLIFAQAIVTKNRVYLIGGEGSGIGVTYVVITAPINQDGSLGSWTQAGSLFGNLSNSQAVIIKNKAYVFGGFYGQNTYVVYMANVNEDGTLGEWVQRANLPTQLASSSVIVTKNRVYLLGGRGLNTSALSTIYSATINSDGSLSAWSSVGNLPVAVAEAQAVVTRNRVYLLGGNNGSHLKTVYSAPVNQDGTLGTWTSDAELPDRLSSSQAIITKNRIYLIGGINSNSYQSAVYYASINGGVNDYMPYFDGTITFADPSLTTFRLPDYTSLETSSERYYIKY